MAKELLADDPLTLKVNAKEPIHTADQAREFLDRVIDAAAHQYCDFSAEAIDAGDAIDDDGVRIRDTAICARQQLTTLQNVRSAFAAFLREKV